jgi:hypothetical protein
MGREESAQVDAETNTFGEAPDEIEAATRKRFEEQAVQRFEQLRADLELSAELNAAVAEALGLDASKIPPELVRKIEEVGKRASQAEPPPLQEE